MRTDAPLTLLLSSTGTLQGAPAERRSMRSLMAAFEEAASGEVFGVEVTRDAHAAEVILHGELDLAAVDEAELALASAERGGQPVVIDFSDLTFIDISGLRMILAAHDRLGSRLTLRGCSPPVHRLFELTGTAERLPLTD